MWLSASFVSLKPVDFRSTASNCRMPLNTVSIKSSPLNKGRSEETMIPRSVFKMNPLFVAVISVFLSSQTSFAQAKVTGIVRAKEQVIIKSELAGVVRRIAVKEGDLVKEGQLLFELDNDHQKINLELSQAGLNKAQAAVEESQVLLTNAERETARLKLAG